MNPDMQDAGGRSRIMLRDEVTVKGFRLHDDLQGGHPVLIGQFEPDVQISLL
jgi:hypothetical protein